MPIIRPETAENKMPLRVLVIGAGLAGLAAALSTKLANPSHEVTILETVSELAEVGVGNILISILEI